MTCHVLGIAMLRHVLPERPACDFADVSRPDTEGSPNTRKGLAAGHAPAYLNNAGIVKLGVSMACSARRQLRMPSGPAGVSAGVTLTTLAEHVAHVVGMGPKKQMRRPYATRIVAVVADKLAGLRPHTMGEKPYGMRDSLAFPSNELDRAVQMPGSAVAGNMAGPKPAVAASIDARPQPFSQMPRNCRHVIGHNKEMTQCHANIGVPARFNLAENFAPAMRDHAQL